MVLPIGGWHRIGLTLSALWLVGCTVYLAFNLHGVFSRTVQAEYNTRNAGQWAAVGQIESFFGCELTGPRPTPQDTTSIEQRTFCRPLWAPIAYLYWIPIALLWSVIPVTALAFRWVMAGFRR